MKRVEYNGKTYLVKHTLQEDSCMLCDIDCVSILQKGGKFPCFGIEKNEYLKELSINKGGVNYGLHGLFRLSKNEERG